MKGEIIKGPQFKQAEKDTYRYLCQVLTKKGAESLKVNLKSA